MAIVYETKEDFERKTLEDQTNKMDNKSLRQGSLAVASVLGSTIIDEVNKKRSGGMRLASIALNAVGIVELVKSLFSASKAHDLKMKHERMGPQVSVIPADASIPVLDTSCPVCHHHKHDHKHSDKIQPTSLLEQAQKQDATLARG